MEDFSKYSKEALEISCRALLQQAAKLEEELKAAKDIIRCVEMMSREGGELVRAAQSFVRQPG